MYLVVSILPLSVIFLLNIWDCSNSVVFFCKHSLLLLPGFLFFLIDKIQLKNNFIFVNYRSSAPRLSSCIIFQYTKPGSLFNRLDPLFSQSSKLLVPTVLQFSPDLFLYLQNSCKCSSGKTKKDVSPGLFIFTFRYLYLSIISFLCSFLSTIVYL